MSAARLREAASLMREQHGPEHARYAMWSAFAASLERVAEYHRPEVDEVYLDECEHCGPDADCDGHDRECCWICMGTSEDGYAVRVFFPCAEMTAALAVANAYLGGTQ